MALKLVRSGPVVVSGTKGSYTTPSGTTPPGWNVWASDGRIVPPPGLYRVTTTAGLVVQKRTTYGKFVEVGGLVRISAGEAITADYRNSEDVVMVENVSPPYFVGFFRRLVGGRRGAETCEARPRRFLRPRWGTTTRERLHLEHLEIRQNLPASGHLLGRAQCGRTDREAQYNRLGNARNSAAPDGRPIQRRRLHTAAVHAGRPSGARHPRLNLSGGEHRGA